MQTAPHEKKFDGCDPVDELLKQAIPPHANACQNTSDTSSIFDGLGNSLGDAAANEVALHVSESVLNAVGEAFGHLLDGL
jgi:hypothetical protein